MLGGAGHGLQRAAAIRTVPAWAWTALALGLVLRLILVFSAPVHTAHGLVGAHNDEASHLNNVRYLRILDQPGPQRVAVHAEGTLVRGAVEYFQPPLYYWPMSWIWDLAPDSLKVPQLLRLFSLLFWYGGLLLLLGAVPDARWRGALLLFGSLAGPFLVSSTTVNNDSLYALVAVGGLYAFAARAAREPLPPLALLNMALLFAVGTWVKLSALPLLPMLLAAAYVNPEMRVRRGVIRAAMAGVIALWATVPLWALRLHLNGSLLGLSDVNEGAARAALPRLFSFIAHTAASPYYELFSSPWIKLGALLLFLLAAFSLIVFALHWRDRTAQWSPVLRKTLLLWGLGGLGTLCGWLYYAVVHQQGEARLLLGAWPALAVLLGWPLWAGNLWVRRAAGWGVLLVLLLPVLAWNW